MKIISIDTMKYTKDLLNNQMSQSRIKQLLQLYKASYPGLTHIALSVPLNDNTEFISHGNNPSPLSSQGYEALWINEVHSAGFNVILRGVFCEAEGIYNFPIDVQPEQHYLDKSSTYLNRIKPLYVAGDIIGIFPESTNNIFNGRFFLTNGLPDGYNSFFTKLIQMIKDHGMTPYITNNYTELNSGWLGSAIVNAQGAVVVDDYGVNGGVSEMKPRLQGLNSKFGKPVFLQEWGDTHTGNTNPQITGDMAMMFADLMDSGVMLGINFWVGWNTPLEGILNDDGTNFSLNAKGLALIPFFKRIAGSQPTPTPIPVPTPVPTPTPVPVPVPTPTPVPVPVSTGQKITIEPIGTPFGFGVYEHQLTIDGASIGRLLIIH